MYLSKKTYVKEWSEDAPKLELQGSERVRGIKPERVEYIIEEFGYWRKANAIHRWFVENVQGGNDDCGSYWVRREKLQELLGLVEHVLADHAKAKELLPAQSGFFFGSTEYDEWYVEDLENTKTILMEALNEEDGEFEYSSSW